MSSSYVRSLNAFVEAEHARHKARQEEKSHAEADAARQKLIPLVARLKKLLDTIPAEVQAEGLSLETVRKMLRGAKGRGAHAGEIGDALRRLGYVRERRWRTAEGGFRAKWYPPICSRS